tara:strand:- start:11 stop:709 length:699 start_codon:yes stop_codon:yes gene_type:complete
MNNFNPKDPLNIFMTVTLLLGLGASSYSWFFIFEEVNQEKKALQIKVDKNTLEINSLKAKKKVEIQLDSQLKTAEEELKTLQKMFPDLEDVTKRLRDLYTVFRQANIDVDSFKPSGGGGNVPKIKGKINWDDPKAYYQENYYQLSLKSGYHSLGDFFAHVANFDYPTRVDNLKLSVTNGLSAEMDNSEVTGQIPKTLMIKLRLTTFTSRATSEVPLKATTKKSKTKNRKGKK